MAKKAAAKRSRKIPYTHTAHHHNESNNFLLIVSGGFVVLIILLFLVANSQSLFKNDYVAASEEAVTEEVIDENTINIGNNAFVDSPMTVRVGDAVTFTNNDTVMHTATADDGSFDTGDIAPGESKVVVLEKAGTFSYHCTHHSDMVGSLVVEE